MLIGCVRRVDQFCWQHKDPDFFPSTHLFSHMSLPFSFLSSSSSLLSVCLHSLSLVINGTKTWHQVHLLRVKPFPLKASLSFLLSAFFFIFSSSSSFFFFSLIFFYLLFVFAWVLPFSLPFSAAEHGKSLLISTLSTLKTDTKFCLCSAHMFGASSWTRSLGTQECLLVGLEQCRWEVCFV